MEKQLLRLREVRVMVSLSPATIYRGVAAGSFPSPVKIGSASRWRLSDLLAWLDGLEAA